ncbi:MAG: DUF4911 domain-containing protein [Bdellovibrionales bacterium]|nr:DUF4911 domain-containing protein [Bdellovibrionales bacterium]
MSTNEESAMENASGACCGEQYLCGDGCCSVLLEVSRADIVFLQAIFESYEGLGTVRTMDKSIPVIAILSTQDMMPVVIEVLESLQQQCVWRFYTRGTPEEKAAYSELLDRWE